MSLFTKTATEVACIFCAGGLHSQELIQLVMTNLWTYLKRDIQTMQQRCNIEGETHLFHGISREFRHGSYVPLRSRSNMIMSTTQEALQSALLGWSWEQELLPS